MTLFQLFTEGAARLTRTCGSDGNTDAQILLLEAFQMDTAHYLLRRMQPLPENEETASSIARYWAMVEQRSRRIPLQQILGSQEFMGLSFFVNEHVLIPRQDTETLVELVLAEQTDSERTVLDLCTGSGCIGISLAVKGGYRQVAASDLSAEALAVAARNRTANGCEAQVQLYHGDLFAALSHPWEPERWPIPARFDVIVSNPPYIPTAVIAALEPEVREHEPMMALDGTADGLLFYRRIADEAMPYLKDGGALYLEIGYDQGAAVKALFEARGFCDVRVCKDLPGKDRVVCARKAEPRNKKEDTHYV